MVCFDLGGVLIRICRSWKEGCAAAGLPLREQSITDPSCANGRREIGRKYQTGQITCDQYSNELAASTSYLYSPHEIQRIHHAWLLGEYEGVGPVIDSIHHAGVRTACLSNTNHAHWIRMDEFRAVMKLQQRFASHELGLVKPDIAIYREFERRTEVPAKHILLLDDLPENIEAARSAGWHAHQIDPHSPTDVQIAAALRAHDIHCEP